MSYEPRIKVVKTRGGSWWIDISDVDEPWVTPHFTILMQEWRDTMLFVNHHTKETIEFSGTSNVCREYGCGQRTYDVYRKQRDRDKEKIGVVKSEDDAGLKRYLTKPMASAYACIQKKLGRNLIRLT